MTDTSLIGYRFPSYSFPVEDGKLRELNRAVLWDGGAQPAPTFSAIASFWIPPDPGGGMKRDLRRVLLGACEWEYLGPVQAGDVLTVHAHIADVREKVGRRGPMTSIVREERYLNQHGQEVMVRRSETLELAPRKEEQA